MDDLKRVLWSRRATVLMTLCVCGFAVGLGMGALTRGSAPVPQHSESAKLNDGNGVAGLRSEAGDIIHDDVRLRNEVTQEEIADALLASGSADDTGLESSKKLLRLLSRLDNDGFRKLAGTFELMYDLDYERERGWMMEAWGQLDGPVAFEYGAKNFARTYSYSAIGNALNGWAARDPQAALERFNAFAAKGMDNHEYANVRDYLLKGWACKNPESLVNYVETSRQKGERWSDVEVGWGYSYAATEMIRRNPLAARSWIEGLPEGVGKETARYNAPVILIESAPEVAKDVFQANADLGYSSYMHEHFARQFSGEGLEEALGWVSGFSGDESKATAIAAITTIWAENSVGAAGAWISEMPTTDEEWDLSAQAFVIAAADQSPEVALGLADTIINDDRRLFAMKKIGSVWYKRDPASAIRWIEEQGSFTLDDLEDFR